MPITTPISLTTTTPIDYDAGLPKTPTLGDLPGIYTVFKSNSRALNFHDKLTLFFFVVLLVVTIFMASFKMNRGIRDYFLANRSFTFFPIGASIFMSNIGSANFVASAGAAARSGLSVYAYELNSVFSLLMLGWVFMPVFIVSGSITTLDFIKKRYGGKRMELYLALVTILFIVFTKAAVELFALYRLLEVVVGKIPWLVACALPLLFATIITCSGGLRAVIYTNTVQFFVLGLGAYFIARYSMQSFESYDSLRSEYFDSWPNTTALHFGSSNDSYKYTNCGLPKAKSWNLFRSASNLELPWPGMVFGIAINSLWYFCCDQNIVQNGLGAKNLVHAKYACIMVAYCKILTILFMVLPGIVARILYKDLVACADPHVCMTACGSEFGCSDMAFPLLFLHIVPAGYRGFVMAAMLACGVSSLSAALNSGSTIFTLNLYRNCKPVATELEVIVVTRVAAVIIGGLSLAAVPLVMKAPRLYDYMNGIHANFTPPIVAVFLCGLLWERASEHSAFRALLLGMVLAVIRMTWRLPYSHIHCGDELLKAPPQILSNFHFLHFAIFVFVLCSVYVALAGVFSEPISVIHLYRLMYWLRHSKLDRVDLNELYEAYRKMKSDQAFEIEEKAVESELNAGRTSSAVEKGEKDVKDSRRSASQSEAEEEEEESDQPATAPPRRRPLGPLTETVRYICCISHEMVQNLVTKDELRETLKERADIRETPVEESTLNLHATMLLLVTMVLWGFLS